jgi:H+/gluconate symporter-like permease
MTLDDLWTVILVLALIGIIILAYYLVKKFNKKYDESLDKDPFDEKVNQLALKDKYMNKESVEYLDFLNKVLPKDYVAFPMVGVDNLVKPVGNKNQYNAVLSKYVDFCIFIKSTMTPILVVDLFDMSMVNNTILSQQDRAVSNALKSVNLPIFVAVKQDYYVPDDILPELNKVIEDRKPKTDKKDVKDINAQQPKKENK